MDQKLYAHSTDEVLKQLRTSKEGLPAHEVEERLKTFGPNLLKSKKKSLLKRIIEPFASLFVSVLIVAVIISIVTHEYVDALIVSIVLIINAIIYYVQQYSADTVLKSLKEQDIALVHVRRGGKILELAAEGLVPGDIVFLNEGMKIPADGRLIECEALYINESVLTGESLPVSKQPEALEGDKQIYDQTNMTFKGTLVHSGSGVFVVGLTGNNTELGKISLLASESDFGRSPIEQKIDDLTKKIVIAVGVVGVVVFGLAIVRGIALGEALRFSMSLVVSVVPEGLPVALTVVLLLSAKKMARERALVKKIASIETLGATTLIATDKTGTLTKNQLSVAEHAFTSEAADTFKKAVSSTLNGEAGLRADPLDAILASEFGEHATEGLTKVKEYPFNQSLRASGVLWKSDKGYILYLKGAPEALLQHSAEHARKAEMEAELKVYAGKGYRTIAVAHKKLDHAPKELHETVISSLTFDGLIGMADEMRDGISDAIQDARTAGITVVMLTGDHADTAREVARKAGLLKDGDEVAESSLLDGTHTPELATQLERVRVFARVLPEHKFNFLKAVKGKHVTAMTGDGVNDIPALVEADAGLAMGSGTDAAKEASDIVIMDNDFKTIIDAVRLGRSVVANIKKMLLYVISTSIGEVATMIGALLLDMPLPLSAAQVLWINIVTDGFTVLPLGLSAPEHEQMKQPPHDPKAPLLNRMYTSRIVVTGIVMAAITLVLYKLALPKGEAYAQTIAFLSLAIAQLANALNANFEMRSWISNFVKPNWMLFGGIILALIFQAIAMIGPFAKAFGTVGLASADLLLAVGAPLIGVLLIGDLHKFVVKKLTK